MKIVKASYKILDELNESDILKKIEKIGRVCYKSEDLITKESSPKFVRMLIDRGHEAMIEHYMFSVKFIVDRGVSHEIVRHRLCAFAQESTRYCNYTKDKFDGHIVLIHPDGLTMVQINRREQHFWNVQELYNTEIKEGISPQIARGVLPTALKTEIVVSANLREWRYIMKLRTPKVVVHPQMIEVMRPLLKDLQTQLPIIFNDIIIKE